METDGQRSTQSIQVEKQKTLRLGIIVIATLILAFCGMYIVYQGTKGGGSGKVNIDLSAGKVSLSLKKPIVDQIQINKSTISSHGKMIEFTEGKINNPHTIKELNSLQSIKPTQFSGKNFINREAGFLLAVAHPENWEVMYNPAGMNNGNIPVNTIYNQEGSNLNIGLSSIASGITIQQFVNANIQSMIQTGMIQQMPVVSYDFPSQTAFAIFTNPMTMGQSYQKVIIDSQNGRAFVASANYNHYLSSPAAIQDLINMIATFTIIQE
ncbi:MAG: hypothetical protein SVW57_03065 [Thermodesulfobacteriota bacterium]|nr:hypothetical protein [Thermodesulfobacteriota bacterium]